jgi:hypothetical protein
MMKKKTIARNYRILHEAATTLATLRDKTELRNEMPIERIQVHLVDESGDGIVLCLEYDDEVVDGELNKTFHSMEEFYATAGDCLDDSTVIQVELENAEDREVEDYWGEPDESAADEEFEEFVKLERKRREPLLN